MWDNTTITMLLEGTRDTLYMTIVSTFFRICAGTSAGNSSCSNRQRGDSSECSCLQSTGCAHEYFQKYSVF